MFYSLLLDDPIVYITNKDINVLEDDFSFVAENPNIITRYIEGAKIRDTFEFMVGDDFTKYVSENQQGLKQAIYRFNGRGLEPFYRSDVPWLYADNFWIDYPTYCEDKDSIEVAACDDCKKFSESVACSLDSSLEELVHLGEVSNIGVSDLTVMPDTSFTKIDPDKVIAYVCIPVVQRTLSVFNNKEERCCESRSED